MLPFASSQQGKGKETACKGKACKVDNMEVEDFQRVERALMAEPTTNQVVLGRRPKPGKAVEDGAPKEEDCRKLGRNARKPFQSL